eukprot:365000-Chlamydomonas_euryale.AAC.3
MGGFERQNAASSMAAICLARRGMGVDPYRALKLEPNPPTPRPKSRSATFVISSGGLGPYGTKQFWPRQLLGFRRVIAVGPASHRFVLRVPKLCVDRVKTKSAQGRQARKSSEGICRRARHAPCFGCVT